MRTAITFIIFALQVQDMQKDVGKRMSQFTEMMRDLKANQMQLQETINMIASKNGVQPAVMVKFEIT